MAFRTTGTGSTASGKSSVLRVMALVCVVLLCFLAAVQVAHIHSSQTLADHCPICVSIHSAAPLAAAIVAAIILVHLGRSTPELEFPRIAIRQSIRLHTRPPPADR
ncbi:MAG TPA: hypothetical protein VF730_16960 [Terracidiphilus sp.]